MKLLLFSDLHTDTSAARRMVDLAEDVDVVIGAGDFANARKGISACIEILRTIRIPTVLVPGNNESYDELVDACADWQNAKVLHGTGVEINGVSFFGIGGGIPVTPFGAWSYDFSEADAERLLANCPSGAVLISHSPPKGVLDAASSGRSLGSTADPPLPILQISSDSSGNYELTLTGAASRLYDIESSSELVSWTTLTTLVNATGVARLTEALQAGQRFFRARLVP